MSKQKINYQWERVHGPDLDPKNKIRREKNAIILKDKIFLEAVDKANRIKGIKCAAVKRQASKWNNKKGAAYKFGR